MSSIRNEKKERIIRILLNTTNKNLSKYKIAKLAECSQSWVGEFIKSLDNLGLVKGTNVINKKELYGVWLKIGSSFESRSYLVQSPIEVLGRINLDFATTTYLGETLIQSHLFPSRVDIYAREEDREKWIEIMRNIGLLGGGNFKIIFTNKFLFDFNQKRYLEPIKKFVNIVSKPQLIVDLLREGGSCKEAAEFLIKEGENGV